MYGRFRTWCRLFGEGIEWKWLGVILSLSIIAVAAFVLYHILHDLDPHKLAKALRSYDQRQILIAGLSVAAGYLTLTFYDLFALRAIGRNQVPYRVAALAAFTSYSIGHNIGASVFTGGAVRYRIYSWHGLSAVDVAKLCFIAGLTFWLGNATVLGLGILYSPESAQAIDHLPLWLNRAVAALALIMLASYVAWVWRVPRRIGRKNWEVTLPNGPLTLVQIAIGIVDLSFCAFAIYMLTPADPHVGFIELSVIFVSATLLGFASHSPGGLGVFDASMLIALWQFDKAGLLACLLLFRLLYYITPFGIAVIILGSRELWLSLTRHRRPVIEPSDLGSHDGSAK